MAKTFLIYPGSRIPQTAAAPVGSGKSAVPGALAPGAAVKFTHHGVQMVGVVANCANGGKDISVRLGVPDPSGVLLVSEATATLPANSLTPFSAATSARKMRVVSTNEPLGADAVKAVAVRDPGTNRILDYTDVMFSGYGSTFEHITARDRDGDSVAVGAFTDTLKEFRKNPVILTDHRNSVMHIAGSYTKVEQDDRGLAVTGKISNAPDPEMVRIRFLIMEGHLRTLSMGGLFIYGTDGRTIEKVYLFEISLVAVPANPDALIQARALDLDSAAKACATHQGKLTI